MATIKSEYYRFNGVSWDIHYFKTTMDMVVGLDTALAGKLDKSGGTMTGDLYVPSVKFTYPIQNFNPFSTYKIHDSIQTNMLAGKWKKLKVTWDGVENTNMARIITDQNYEQYNGDTPHGVDGDADHVLNIDFVTNGLYGANGITYAEGTIIFNFYAAPFPTAWSCRWKDKNGVWTSITLTKNGYAQLIGKIPPTGLYLTNIELTLSTGTGAPYITSNIKWAMCEAEYYGTRMTLSQGGYLTAVGGYVSGDIDVGGALKVGGQNVYHPSNKPSITDLGALVETNQKLLFGSTTQYIRLAYVGSKTTGYIKHASGAEYELYHAGNFNPSDYMPKTGGTFTGTVSFTGLTSFETLDINTMYVDTIASDGGSIAFSGVDYVDFDLAVLRNVSDPYLPADAVNKAYLDARIFMPDAWTVKVQKDFIEMVSASDFFKLSDEGLPQLRCGVDGNGELEVFGSIWTNKGLSTAGAIYEQGNRVATEGVTTARVANYTFVLADKNNFIYSNTSTSITFTIPTNASVAFAIGTEIHVMRNGTGELSIAPASGVTLNSEGAKRRINAQYQAATLKKIDTNTWVLIGALKS